MISDEEYKKLLKQFHKLSDRHILVVETDMPYSDALKVVILSDKIRKAGNELVSFMRKNYDQLIRTKKYRKLLKLYCSTKDKKKRKDLADQLNESGFAKFELQSVIFYRYWNATIYLFCSNARQFSIF